MHCYFLFCLYSLWGYVCRSERGAVTGQLTGAISLSITWCQGLNFELQSCSVSALTYWAVPLALVQA